MTARRRPQPVRLYLVATGRTITALAAELGVAREVLGRWCSGREKCPAPRRAALAALLGVPEHELFDYPPTTEARS
jgi:DNA-binding transcriptional regulator YdaS (Cro superfamily)